MGYLIFQSSNLIDWTYHGGGLFCNLDRGLIHGCTSGIFLGSEIGGA